MWYNYYEIQHTTILLILHPISFTMMLYLNYLQDISVAESDYVVMKTGINVSDDKYPNIFCIRNIPLISARFRKYD